MKDLLLGVDVGTTGTKTMLLGVDGQVHGEAYQGYPLSRPGPLQVEQDAQSWWDAVVSTTRQVVGVHAHRVRAISVSAQGGSLVVTDRQFTPLAPARSWLDRRADAQTEDIVAEFGRRDFFERTGWPVYGAYTAVQLLNLRHEQPDLFDDAAYFLGTAEFVNSRLVGRAVGELNSAGISQLTAVRDRIWDAEILQFLNVDQSHLPELHASGAVLGGLSAGSATELGLPMDVVVVGGGHDQYCAALGAGVVEPGDLLISTGTAWVTLGVTQNPVHDPAGGFALGSHVADGVWGQFGSFRNGGVCLDWVRELLAGATEPDAYDTVQRLAAEAAPGAAGLNFFPFFDGTTIPTWSDDAKGTFLDVELRHGRGEFYRAVMEGVAMELRRVVESYERFVPERRRTRLLGGGSKSPVWVGIIAAILDRPLEILDLPNSACVGAAMLAGVGAGIWPDAAAADLALPRAVNEVKASPILTAQYAKAYERYLSDSDNLLDLYRSRAQKASS